MHKEPTNLTFVICDLELVENDTYMVKKKPSLPKTKIS